MNNLRKSVLTKALEFVPQHGFTATSIEMALQHKNLSVGFIGSVQPIDLVDYSQTELLSRIEASNDSDLYCNLSRRFKSRNNIMKNYAAHWVGATVELSKYPVVASHILQQQCHDLLYNSGDKSVDVNWYLRYGLLSNMIVTSDLYLSQDESLNFTANDKFVDEILDGFKRADLNSMKIAYKLEMMFSSILK
eukprot:NODE_1_length_95616_cov_0.657642.p55 type:complete len:192 gc:universal NODE_1_length_95616_cov_0.657642:35038-35613(+)